MRQIMAVNQPDMFQRTERRTVQHPEFPADLAWKQRGVFVVWGDNQAEAIHCLEIFRRRQADSRAQWRIAGVGDCVFVPICEVHQARVFAAIGLKGQVQVIGMQQRLCLNAPVLDPVTGARDGDMGTAFLVNDAQQQQHVVAHDVGGGVADTIAGVGQVAGADDGVRFMAGEKFMFKHREVPS